MAEAPETLTVEYDSTNDVLRIMVIPRPEDAIAVFGTGSTTLLVSESYDRVVGMVLSPYLPGLREQLPPELASTPDETLLQISTAALVNVAPPLMQKCGPLAKDAIVSWLAIVNQREMG